MGINKSAKMSAEQDPKGANMAEAPKAEFTELDWITLKTEIGSEELKHVESAGEKFKRKFWENPVLPVGAGLTTLALLLGLRAFRRQDKHMSQLMMRARVGAQGFTVLALLGGVLKTAFDAKQ